MNVQKNTPPQSSVILRILGGGYLVYLAWDMRGALADRPWLLIPILFFGVGGLVLAGGSIHSLITNDYFKKDPKPETETKEDWEELTDE